jgi:hypothetical protein
VLGRLPNQRRHRGWTHAQHRNRSDQVPRDAFIPFLLLSPSAATVRVTTRPLGRGVCGQIWEYRGFQALPKPLKAGKSPVNRSESRGSSAGPCPALALSCRSRARLHIQNTSKAVGIKCLQNYLNFHLKELNQKTSPVHRTGSALANSVQKWSLSLPLPSSATDGVNARIQRANGRSDAPHGETRGYYIQEILVLKYCVYCVETTNPVSHVDRCLGQSSGDALHFRLPRTRHRRPPSLPILSKSPRLPVGVDQSSGPAELGGRAAPSREEPVERQDRIHNKLIHTSISLLCESQLESGM